MSTVPVATQVRRPVTMEDGNVGWEISTTITNKGNLPFAELFVVTIVDPLDPKTDVLAQIATPQQLQQANPGAPIFVKVDSSSIINISGDTFAQIASIDQLTALQRDRVLAVNLKQTQYLVSAITIIYDSVSTANAAYLAILDRLSQLVIDWDTASSSIITTPTQSYNLPSTTQSVEAQLIAAYTTAASALKVAEAQRDAASAAAAACQQTATANKQIYDFLAYDVGFLQAAATKVSAFVETTPAQGIAGTFTTVTVTPPGSTLTAPGTILGPAPTHVTQTFVLNSGDPTSYASLLVAKQAQLTKYQGLVRTSDQNCAAMNQALLQAQAAVNVAQTTATNALGSVLAVCPSFVPSS